MVNVHGTRDAHTARDVSNALSDEYTTTCYTALK